MNNKSRERQRVVYFYALTNELVKQHMIELAEQEYSDKDAAGMINFNRVVNDSLVDLYRTKYPELFSKTKALLAERMVGEME